jgi:hypothetical protein
MNSCIAIDYPIASSQTWAPTSIITSSGSTARTAGSTSKMFQSPIHGPMDKSSMPTEWYSTPSRRDCTMLLTQRRKVDQGTAQCTLGAAYSTHQADGTVTLFPVLRLRSYSTCRRHVRIVGSRAIRRRHI